MLYFCNVVEQQKFTYNTDFSGFFTVNGFKLGVGDQHMRVQVNELIPVFFVVRMVPSSD
jgi:hypothetical protein